jgi:hypothetical protein
MVENFSTGDERPVDLLVETEDLYRLAAEDLARARRGLRAGQIDEAKAALQAVKDLKAAFQMVMDERGRVEKLRKHVAGAIQGRELDFDAARAEIGRRLACLRDAGSGG